MHLHQVSTPALIIMLGSTPSRAGMELCRHMLALSPEDCRRIALVHIDTAEQDGDLKAFYKDHEGIFRSFHRQIEIPKNINYTAKTLHSMHTYIPSVRPQPFDNGAGGIRNNGHVAASLQHTKLRQTLEEALHSLEQLDTSQGAKAMSEVHVNIVAFLGGGTGSGILPDIAIMMRQILIDRSLGQRINLFCILPDWIQGSNNNDISWRKSNTVACLLELLALSLAAKTGGKNVYDKFMFDHNYEVSAGAIANEIYLIGRTSMANADDTARIVGLDLFQRVVDASGVGWLEHANWMNRRGLGATDDRGLPTMFATSCPLEVRFPKQETAQAFAQLSTNFLLAAMIGQAPPPPDIPDELQKEWVSEWHNVAVITTETQGNPLAVQASQEFAPSDFLNIDLTDQEALKEETKRRCEPTRRSIEKRIKQKRQEDLQKIALTPGGSAASRENQFTRRLLHLRLLNEEYRTIYELIRDVQPETPDIPEISSAFFHFLPGIGRVLSERAASEACNRYNEYLREQAQYVRFNELRNLLKELRGLVAAQIEEVNRWFEFHENRLKQECKKLLTQAQNSAAWHGKLDSPHPHQRHLFDLNSLQTFGPGKGLEAVERLYMAVTFPVRDQDQVLLGTAEQHYSQEYVQQHINRYIEDCTRELNKGTSTNDLRSRENFAQQVVAFFTQYYLKEFQTLNLGDLLNLGLNLNGGSTTPYLLEHLSHMNGLVRNLIAFQETLWRGGSDSLFPSLFLGMATHGHQRSELEEAINKLGTLSENGLSPMFKEEYDPHCLHVVYSQHGLSLTSIPDFFRASNSSMAEYIRHQNEWYGQQQPQLFSNPSTNTYGQNRMPVHSSGEMERLVCDKRALGYQSNQPHATIYGHNLIGRVIRETEDIDEKPNWGP